MKGGLCRMENGLSRSGFIKCFLAPILFQVTKMPRTEHKPRLPEADILMRRGSPQIIIKNAVTANKL